MTDRDDLDKQIKDTFKSSDLEPVRATSGAPSASSASTCGSLLVVQAAEDAAHHHVSKRYLVLSKGRQAVDKPIDKSIYVYIDTNGGIGNGRSGSPPIWNDLSSS